MGEVGEAAAEGRPLRPEIASSWERSRQLGLTPEAVVDRLTVADYDRRSRLLIAATPALDRAAAELAGAPFSLLLADRDGWVVDRRVGEHDLQATLDRLGVIEGRQFTEENTGTNSIATAFELRRGIAVHGDEHFFEVLKVFACYGLPIVHPITRRLEGVLDVTCPAAQDSPLLVPFLHRTLSDIESHLVEGSRQAEQRMLAMYQAAQRRTRPVLVLGDDVALANTAATDLLESADHALLRALAADSPVGSRRLPDVPLSGGRTVTVHVERVPGAGVLVELEPDEPARAAPVPRGRTAGVREPWRDELARYRARGVPVLITGEPGTGRTSAGLDLAEGRAVHVLPHTPADDALADLARFTAEPDPGVLVLADEIELMRADVLAALAAAVEAEAPWLCATGRPVSELNGPAAELAARFVARVELAPLRLRRHELPALVRAMAPEGTRFLPKTVEVLAASPWPGNLRELAAVLRHLESLERAVTPQDLPEPYRNPRRVGRGTLEQVEHDAIVAALRLCGGNKTHAAEHLGISRSTLLRRLRTLGIAT